MQAGMCRKSGSSRAWSDELFRGNVHGVIEGFEEDHPLWFQSFRVITNNGLLPQVTYEKAVAQWSTCCTGHRVNEASLSCTPGRDEVKGFFSVRPSQRLWTLVSVCLAFVRTARTEIVAQFTTHMCKFSKRRSGGVE